MSAGRVNVARAECARVLDCGIWEEATGVAMASVQRNAPAV